MSSIGKPSASLGMQKHGYSVASGALACFASVLGKVAFDGDTPFQVKATASCREHFPELALCSTVGLAVQGASLAGMFMVNAVMLSIYLKALQMSGSTVATVTNFATNFLLSGISGRIIFGERLPMLWFCGASLVVVGVMLLTGGGDDADDKKAPHTQAGGGGSSPSRQTRSEARNKKDRSKRD